MTLANLIEKMPKIELHVHLEGSTQPETLLKLAKKNNIDLPAKTLDEVRGWYQFRDFDHFIQIYITIVKCIKTADDIEWIARDFLARQAEQNIIYSEVTYSAYTQYENHGLSLPDQFEALERANDWAKTELGVSMGVVVDLVRDIRPESGLETADWFIKHRTPSIVAFGLGGTEVGNPPEKHQAAFERILAAGDIPIVPHAGETAGADSIWSAITVCQAVRIGHGVRCLEDDTLVAYLRDHQIPLEVSPTSNVCLGVVDSIANHPIQKMMDAGLVVTVNSDDPPMFNTTLTNEFKVCAEAFDWDADQLKALTLNAVDASFLPDHDKLALHNLVEEKFVELA